MGRRPKGEEQPVHQRLEEARIAAGISRAELAEITGVHYQTIGYLERGEYHPSLALALRVAAALDVSVESLFSLTPFE
mgnify:FL=1|jgi:DNA-binding XRE family transcriptional regulator